MGRVTVWFAAWVVLLMVILVRGNTGRVSIDSPLYTVNWWHEWFHPHHLLWTPLLGVFHAMVSILITLDRFESAAFLCAMAAAGSVLVVFSLLTSRAGCTPICAMSLAGVFAFSPLHLELAWQAEAYTSAVLLLLVSHALVCPNERMLGTRNVIAIICVVGAVLLHQKSCMAVLPLLIAFWSCGKRWHGVRFVAICAASSLAAYLVVFARSNSQESLANWLFRYREEFAGMGRLDHALSAKAWGGFAWNLASSWCAPLITRRDASGAIVALVLVIVYLGWVATRWRPSPWGKSWLLHVLLFESVLLWWHPTLSTMQYFSHPFIVLIAGTCLSGWKPRPSVAVIPPLLFAGLSLSSGRFFHSTDIATAREKCQLAFPGATVVLLPFSQGFALETLARDAGAEVHAVGRDRGSPESITLPILVDPHTYLVEEGTVFLAQLRNANRNRRAQILSGESAQSYLLLVSDDFASESESSQIWERFARISAEFNRTRCDS